MNNQTLKRTISLLLCVVLLFGGVPFTPLSFLLPAKAMEFDYATFSPEDGEWTFYFVCPTCNTTVQGHIERDEDYDWEAAADAYLTDIEKETDYCRDCYMDYICVDCHEEFNSDYDHCRTCHKCRNCWDADEHCISCGQEKEMCEECVEAGEYICKDCHPEYAECEGCGRCLLALTNTNEVCYNESTHDTHCTTCDEPWICLECGECFYGREEWFCELCGMCLECAAEAGEHCKKHYECLLCTDICEDNEDLCLDCCVAEGNHCEICDEHIEDDWCEGGKDCHHCVSCAEENDWICYQCGRCMMCSNFEFCEDCGLCTDCCKENAAELGCECLEYCVESADFDDPGHRCEQCGEVFACADGDFCGICGLCEECCLENSEEGGCVCGICVEDGDYADHFCERCSEPTCVRGDFCATCGLCEECCLELSEDEGCSCGKCLEDGFDDPEHMCENCGALSCNIDFCDVCGLCEDCCAANSLEEYGCDHGVCCIGDGWENHYCTECDKCKEECICGKSCCADPSADKYLHGTDVAPGTVLIQPTDKKRRVTANNKYERAENTVTFRTQVYDPDCDLLYQWYYSVNGGEPVKLIDESDYIDSSDETLVFVGGAGTQRLTVAVPSDACHNNYAYYCVISDADGNRLSTTNEARLVGKHVCAWQYLDGEYHQYACIGEGCDYVDIKKKAHEIGPWRYLSYATASKGAVLVRTCRVCGSICERQETEPLGENHTSHDFIYIPVETVNSLGETECTSHIKVCRCGLRDGGEEPHVNDKWIVTEPATDKKKGSKYHDCLLCNYRETVVIGRQTHEHTYNFRHYDEVFEGVHADRNYHWQECTDPDCNAVAFKEPHVYSEWYWETEYGKPTSLKDGAVYRYCEVCGYRDEAKIHADRRAVTFLNASKSVLSGDTGVEYEVTAKPPVGWYFMNWEDIGEAPLEYAWYYAHDESGKLIRNTDGTPKTVYYSKDDPTVRVKAVRYDDDGNFVEPDRLYQLKANCLRYDNAVIAYYPGGGSEYLQSGGVMARNDDPHADMDNEECVLWYSDQSEDEYGYRTVTLHLNSYNNGALELENTGLPCNMNIIVDEDSSVTTEGYFGILGCAAGGDITISSTTGATLRIKVRNGKNECFGIRAGRDKPWNSDKITLAGNVNVIVDVTDTSAVGKAYGLYSNSWVEVLDDASLCVNVSSYAYSGDEIVVAEGIHAGKEVQIDTTGCITIDATNIDAAHEKKARGISAKNILVDKVSIFKARYTDNSRSAFNAKPVYDHKNYMSTTSPGGSVSFKKNGTAVSQHPTSYVMICPGHPVTFTKPEGVVLNVDEWYTDDAGNYLVEDGSTLSFYTAPEPGFYGETVYVGGKLLKAGASDDGVRTHYIIENVTAPLEITITKGTAFVPFASQPVLTQKKVFYGSEAIVTYRMNNIFDTLARHEAFGGDTSGAPKFSLKKKTLGGFESGELIQNGQSVNKVFLQRYSDSKGEYENTDISFTPSKLGNVSFTDPKYAGKFETVRYRLMVLYDGMEYASDPFTVEWTDDENDRSEPITTVADIYVRSVESSSIGISDEGGGWIRLNHEKSELLYNVDTEKAYAGTPIDLLHGKRFGNKLLCLASFDYHTGTLTLYGDTHEADFDGDGGMETYYFGDMFKAIRVPKMVGKGRLIIDVRADTTVMGDYDSFGFHGGSTENCHTYGQSAVILNDTANGNIRITSKNGAALTLARTGAEADNASNRTYYGINAAGDVRVDGNVRLQVFVDANMSTVSNPSRSAARYGIKAAGDILCGGNATVNVMLPFGGGEQILKGDAAAMKGADITVKDNASVTLASGAGYVRGDEMFATLYAGNLNVTGSASLRVTAANDVLVPIRAEEDVLFSTAGNISIASEGSASSTYDMSVGGETRIISPTVVSFTYNGATAASGLLTDDAPVFDGDYVIYDNGEEGYCYPGTPYTLTIDTDYGALNNAKHDIVVTRDGKHSVTFENDGSLDVCAGDTVSIVARSPINGYTFDGWTVGAGLAAADYTLDDAWDMISFTMPDHDVGLHAVYTCTAFDAKQPCFVITDRYNEQGLLFWAFDVEKFDVSFVELERYDDTDGAWYSMSEDTWYLNDDATCFWNGDIGKYTFTGAYPFVRAGSGLEGIELDTDVYTTYRVKANCAGEYLYSQPFTIDFDCGVHILLSRDSANPDLIIPADYVGTEYLVDLTNYLYSDNGDLKYSCRLEDASGPITKDICEVSLFENGLLRFVRNGAHDAIDCVEGTCLITVTDENTNTSVLVPFALGEIYDTEKYPLIVSGTTVTEHNKDDILGDGTASYDPDTKTLTLCDAVIDELYPMYSDGDLISAAYGIVSAEDLTICLKGENTVSVSEHSFCRSQAVGNVFHGSIVGIGNVSNDDWRPYLDADDAYRLTFTGDGSLSVLIDSDDGFAVYSIGDVTVDSGIIDVRSDYAGIDIEKGSFVMNGGELTVNVERMSCVSIYDKHARFTVNGGGMTLNGGTNSCVISAGPTTMQNANYLRINDGSVLLTTKSDTYDLSSRALYYDAPMYTVYAWNAGETPQVLGACESGEGYDNLRFARVYPIWINGERFTAEHTEIKCGDGYAFYVPEVNTVYLQGAEITRGVAYYEGAYYADGIHTEQPVNLYFSGINTIDLSAKDFVTLSGEPYTREDEETEKYRKTHGIRVGGTLSGINSDSFDEKYLGLAGGWLAMNGVRFGIDSAMPINYDGLDLDIPECEGGIVGDMDINAGMIRINASAYGIYGFIDTEDYFPKYAYGGTSEDDYALLDASVIDGITERDWGFDYPYFKLHGTEEILESSVSAGIMKENEVETKISVDITHLAHETPTDVVVVQYKSGRVTEARVVTVYPSDFDDVILLTFGTDTDATYRVYALDKELTPLTDVYQITR